MLAAEPLPIRSGRRPCEIVQIPWPAEQTLVARGCYEKDRADIDAGGLCGCQAPSWNENMKCFSNLAVNSENIS
jgi:hypothetical protein